MGLKIFYIHFRLFFMLTCGSILIANVEGRPQVAVYDGYVDSIDREYAVPYQHPITDYHLSRLQRGYYYVEDGFITAIPESVIYGDRRRLDTVATNGAATTVSEQQLTKYKRTNGKRKKLFVPNLFG